MKDQPDSAAQAIVRLDDVSKAYRIWRTPSSRLWFGALEKLGLSLSRWSSVRQWLHTRAARHYRDFYALSGITFSLGRGESLGIIGRNGAGKSTLLQIITGTLRPTTGNVQVSGRVSALLELGSGFNPEFTGRENVFLNGSVLGLSREEMEARFGDIADFAGIGDFMEQPIKCYSSGMQLRLAFAVAVHVDPDVLIIDEALAVGDARFQLKCARAIDRFREEGVSILFVSHDLSSVKRLCHQAILLEQGRVLCHGHPNDVSNLYTKLLADGGSIEALQEDIKNMAKGVVRPIKRVEEPPTTKKHSDISPGADAAPAPNLELANLRHRVRVLEKLLCAASSHPGWAERIQALVEWEQIPSPQPGYEFAYGGSEGKIRDVYVLDEKGHHRSWFESGERVRVGMVVEALEDFPEPIYALTIKNKAGVEIYGTNTFFAKLGPLPIHGGQQRRIEFSFPLSVMAGTYFLSFGFTHFVGNELLVIHRRYDAILLDIHAVDQTFGLANLQATIDVKDHDKENV